MAGQLKQFQEYKSYELLQLWKAIGNIEELKQKITPLRTSSKLFEYLYNKTEKIYNKLPQRKNGEDAFVHPLNVVVFLQQAGVTDEVTLCAGLVHDIVEEEVDIYKDENKIKGYRTGLNQLDQYEQAVFKGFQKELLEFCKKEKIPAEKVAQLIIVTKLLTRHKKDFYYKYITRIFACNDPIAQERALQVKLADRIHNSICIECFNEEERTFQCFKNLFILNNTKRHLLKKNGAQLFTSAELTPLEILFKKCGKATYEAYLNICHLCIAKGMGEIKVMLQLAFKKFALEKAGVWEVTKLDEKEMHLMRLFHDVVRKYDYRLYHKWKQFETIKGRQRRYCEKFFADYNYSPEIIQAIIDYKDAYALKEVVAYLLYLPDYILGGFESENFFRQD